MATITSTPTASSITVSGNTQKTGTISWTKPTVPSGATISSCVLTGTATASMSKGSATITVNGTTVTSGSQFTINLGTENNTTSVTTTAKGGNKNASGTVSFSNLVYTVTYTEQLPTYTVTFVDWNGTVLKTQEVEEGSSAAAPSNPSRTGYTFTGWDKTFTNVTSNLTVTAQYTINSYTVTFKDHDGTTLKTQTVNYGSNATPPSDPVRDGYTFTGWDTTFNNVTSDLTVTAQYTQNSSGGGGTVSGDGMAPFTITRATCVDYDFNDAQNNSYFIDSSGQYIMSDVESTLEMKLKSKDSDYFSCDLYNQNDSVQYQAYIDLEFDISAYSNISKAELTLTLKCPSTNGEHGYFIVTIGKDSKKTIAQPDVQQTSFTDVTYDITQHLSSYASNGKLVVTLDLSGDAFARVTSSVASYHVDYVGLKITGDSSGGGEEPEVELIEWTGLGTVATGLHSHGTIENGNAHNNYKINLNWENESFDIIVQSGVNFNYSYVNAAGIGDIIIGSNTYYIHFNDGSLTVRLNGVVLMSTDDQYIDLPIVRFTKDGIYVIGEYADYNSGETFPGPLHIETIIDTNEPVYFYEDYIYNPGNSINDEYELLFGLAVSTYEKETPEEPEYGEESYAPFTITSYTDFDEDLGQNFLYIRNPNNTVNIANLTTALSSADEQTISFEPDTSTTNYEGIISINFDLSSYSNITKAELVAIYSNNNVNYAADFSGTRITIDGTTIANLYTDSANFATDTFDITTQVQNKTAVTCNLICDFAGSYSLSRIIDFYPSMDVDYIGLKITEGSSGGGGEPEQPEIPESELVTKTEALRPISVTQDSGYNNTWTDPANTYDTDTSTSGTLIVTGSSQTGFKRKYVDTVFNFDTSHIPADATINSATLTIRAKQSATTNLNMTASINGNDVIASTLLSSSTANYTADVKDYVKGLGQLNVNLTSAATSNRTFTLYDVRIDVDYSYYEVPAPTYTVTFVDWDGFILKTETVKEGNSATPPSDPDNRPGFIFTGWSGDYTNITSDVTITAQYTEDSSGGETTYISKLHIGELIIDKLYLGEFSVEKIYIGEVLLFGKDVNE